MQLPVQLPPWHVVPGQIIPHPPQLFRSRVTFTQRSEQHSSSDVQTPHTEVSEPTLSLVGCVSVPVSMVVGTSKTGASTPASRSTKRSGSVQAERASRPTT